MAKNWFLIISFLFLGCFEKENVPDLIPQETFKSILKDIYGTHGFQNLKHAPYDTIQIFLNETLNRYKVNDTIYKQTLLFYIENPENFIKIIKEIEAS
ncbi:MAG: hypothetical protein CMD26_04640 [Flavobacteriales bacterium]|nr:hypothetical protein [Flavobacteriales bacterium]